ncbi:predicted protein [Nematostella vectensis]|uniref:SRCR domain-containing protein n=1 Tax=Nematostella vectensis TaxID=45351 RepID=A7RX86_NEMVE|nr:uncharacterized protein LOC5515935 [Nematostella vectensis]EDO43987.1 predicted protein [Nematostella vectensis]|eukprot:XP_001636050.1 predicted protein [Nematostella vectensis]
MARGAIDLVLIVLVTVSCARAQICKGGLENTLQGTCDQSCGEAECLCSGETPSHEESLICRQQCDSKSPITSNVTQCLDMKCTNVDTCVQNCHTGSCSLNCHAKQSCSQECVNPEKVCPKVVCSAQRCFQRCFNCTMICTGEVRFCDQTCLGGVCYAKCKGKSCSKKCSSAEDTACDIYDEEPPTDAITTTMPLTSSPHATTTTQTTPTNTSQLNMTTITTVLQTNSTGFTPLSPTEEEKGAVGAISMGIVVSPTVQVLVLMVILNNGS